MADDAFDMFAKENGRCPDDAFQLMKYSKTAKRVSTLSYNKALIIFEKHDKSKSGSQSTKRSSMKAKPTSTNAKTMTRPGPINHQLSLSTTDPTSPDDEDPGLCLQNSSDSDHSVPPLRNKKQKNGAAVLKRASTKPNFNKRSSKGTKSMKSKRKSHSNNNNNKHKNTSTPTSPTSISISTPTPHTDDSKEEYTLDDQVLLNQDREGIIRYIGTVHFIQGVMYGIELTNGSIGKHDGMVDDKRYFQTEPTRAIFVKPKNIRRRLRAKDFRTAARLRRVDSIDRKSKSRGSTSGVKSLIDVDDIKLIHQMPDTDAAGGGGITPVSNAITAHDTNPMTERGRTKQQRRESGREKLRTVQRTKRSISAAGTNPRNDDDKHEQQEQEQEDEDDSSEEHKIAPFRDRSVDDTDIPPIMNAQNGGGGGGLPKAPSMWSQDNSDWDDSEIDDESDPPEPQQTADDMVIDNYIPPNFHRAQTTAPSTAAAIRASSRRPPPPMADRDRVHSRIPNAPPQRNFQIKAAHAPPSAAVPASFKQYQTYKSSGIDWNAQKVGRSQTIVHHDENLSKRSNRNGIIKRRDDFVKQHGARHHQTAHNVASAMSPTTSTADEEKKAATYPKPKLARRRSSLESASLPMNGHKNKADGASQSSSSLYNAAGGGGGATATQNYASPPKVENKHSRFASVTNVFAKGWNWKFSGTSSPKKASSKLSKKQLKPAPKKPNAVFGIDPSTLIATMVDDTDYASPIPNVLITLKQAIFAVNGHLEEGIFRKAPNATDCKRVIDQLNDGKFSELKFEDMDCMLLANLIKVFFREFPVPLLQNVDSAKIEKVQHTRDMQDVANIMQNELSEPYKSYYAWLVDLCREITQHRAQNLMTSKNMAVVVAPNLFDPIQMANPMKAMTVSGAIVEFLQLSMEWREQSLNAVN
eukprot:CAMPEP_0202691010 /NCGR_PEP_ID=MMETSP1385-20130828/5848_1 /ASSEMBLY_ACC=CAM_ASM_000861 /TAXON_ID=933848 /ORGANISM="Elphidium margaritaceum" /LENGTH=920 /DNA_ID=CAMNT_0049346351 /DNA_START=23 /DNA_END=2785 /DNA_ORIENTATION=-